MCKQLMMGLGLISAMFMQGTVAMAAEKNVVFIGASTGNRWKLPDFPQRVRAPEYNMEFLKIYEFDKSKLIDEVIKRPQKPDAVIIKECSVYFPGPQDAYKKQFASWVASLKQAGIKPMVATVVPPATSQGFVADTKEFIKVRLLGRDNQFQQVVDFNNWLREFAQKENIPVVDLEQALRRSDADRHMVERFDSGDGIHINKEAYDVLDGVLLKTLRNADVGKPAGQS